MKLATSPRKKLLDIKATVALTSKPLDLSRNVKSPRLNIREFMVNQIPESEVNSSNIENGVHVENELSKIPEENQAMTWGDLVEQEESQMQEPESNVTKKGTEEVVENHETQVNNVIMFDQYSQTSGFIDEYLTLQQWRDKYENDGNNAIEGSPQSAIEAAVSHTVNKLDEMENQFLTGNANQPSILIETTTVLSDSNKFNMNKENNCEDLTKCTTPKIIENNDKKTVHPEEKKAQVTGPLKYSNVVNRSAAVTNTMSSQKTVSRIPPTKTLAIPTRATTLNNVANTTGLKKLPLKTATILSTTKPKVPTQKCQSAAYSDSNCRPSTTNLRSNGVPSNTASRLAARSKTMIDLGHGKQQNSVNRTNISKSSSRDSFASSTSTLRASNDQISNSQTKLNSRRSEPKQLPTSAQRMEDNDGWLTVKARRRSSLHWSNRFDQPSGYASLPTLALLNEKETSNVSAKSANKKENKKATKPESNKSLKAETAKSTATTTTDGKIKASTIASAKNQTNDSKPTAKIQPTTAAARAAPKTKIQKSNESTSTNVTRATILQRQKSDITGIKLTNLRKEYFRQEKKLNCTKKLEDLPIQSPTENKVSMNIQTNMGFSSTMCNLYTNIANNDSQKRNKDDIDDKEYESDENQRKLVEEQECLERQIFELQNTEIEFDTETDDADCETILDLEEGDSAVEIENCDENISLEMKYQYLLSDMTSRERIETLATLQAIESRYPGRAQQLHQKLSSPSRRRSLHETLKKYQAKQARAQDMRDALHKEKALKLQTLLTRVEDVKAAKQQLIDEKRLRMEEKLQRYAENRNQYLKDKVRKAHDEEEKLKEIAFIKSLEAQNKRLDLMELRKEQEGRLQDLEQERQKRMEEKAAKEAAVERRRLELAKERQIRLEKMDETRRKREQRVEQKQEEKEKMRQKMAREKVNRFQRKSNFSNF